MTSIEFQNDTYEEVKELGKGGLGTAYLMRAPDGKQVVYKIFRKSVAPKILRRCMTSMTALQGLEHPMIQRVLAVFEHRYSALLSYIPGEQNLSNAFHDTMSSHERIPLLRRIFRKTVENWGFLKDNGVAHRDIKPDNILTSGGLVDPDIAERFNSCVSITSMVTGTPFYMSPEAVSSLITPTSDQFSIGVTFAQLLYGLQSTSYTRSSVKDFVSDRVTKGFQFDFVAANKRLISAINASQMGESEKGAFIDMVTKFSLVLPEMTKIDPKSRYKTPDEIMHVFGSDEIFDGLPIRNENLEPENVSQC